MTLTALEAFELHYVPRHKNLTRSAANAARTNLRRWAKLADPPDPTIDRITDVALDVFRDRAKAAGYSVDSIENSVQAVLAVLRLCAAPHVGLLSYAPDVGSALRVARRVKYAPPLADLGKMYAAAWVAQWPRFCRADDFWRAVLVLGLWTALRRTDVVRSVTWDCFTDESIAVTANKTQKLHVFPVSLVVARHLEPLKGLDPRLVFPMGECWKQFRRELARIADAAEVRRIGLQAVRRRSCSEWQAAKWGAGEIVQGSGIRGSASRYIVPEILHQAAPRFRWPAEMLTPEERDEKAQQEKRLLEVVRRLGQADRAAVLSLAEKLAG